MRGIPTLLALVITLVVIQGCSGGDKGSTPIPGDGGVNIITNGLHANQTALVRFKANNNDIVCIEQVLNGNGDGQLSSVGEFGIGVKYKDVELILNVDGNAVFDRNIDHNYKLHSDFTVSTGFMLTFNHNLPSADDWDANADPSQLAPGQSWKDAFGCPGQ